MTVRSQRDELLTAMRALIVVTVITGLVFPLVLTGVAQVVFGDQAEGSLIERRGLVVGARGVGQSFTAERYFHGRPSAATPEASGASNLGPSNPLLLDTVSERVDDYRRRNGLAADVRVPIDAVTASGSGLDPHISVANALLQAPRVATARCRDIDVVRALVGEHTEGRALGFLGEPGVDVLTLNLALDDLTAGP